MSTSLNSRRIQPQWLPLAQVFVVMVVVLSSVGVMTSPLRAQQSPSAQPALGSANAANPANTSSATAIASAEAALTAAPEFTSVESSLKEPSKVLKVNLSYNGLTDFPLEVLRCTNVRVLDVSNNGLTTLPDEIATLPNLQKLVIATNGFRKVPACIEKIKSLKVLDLSQNQIPFKDLERLRAALPNVQIID
jgi:Leucine-rich repeat (LRR) protein